MAQHALRAPRVPKRPLLKAQRVDFDSILFHVQKVDPRKMDRFDNMKFGNQLKAMVYSPTHDKVLSFVGGRYNVVDNETLVMPVYDRLVQLFGHDGFEMLCWNYDDRQFSIQFILHDKTIEVADKDLLNAMIEVQNSYDGSLQQSAGLSYYRQICSNGLMGWRQVAKVTQKHHASGIILLDPILERLDQLDGPLRQFRRLTERRVTLQEMAELRETFKASKVSYSFPKRLVDIAIDRIGLEADAANTDPNAWLVYNSFNRILNHHDRVGMTISRREGVDQHVLETIGRELHVDLLVN